MCLLSNRRLFIVAFNAYGNLTYTAIAHLINLKLFILAILGKQ